MYGRIPILFNKPVFQKIIKMKRKQTIVKGQEVVHVVTKHNNFKTPQGIKNPIMEEVCKTIPVSFSESDEQVTITYHIPENVEVSEELRESLNKITFNICHWYEELMMLMNVSIDNDLTENLKKAMRPKRSCRQINVCCTNAEESRIIGFLKDLNLTYDIYEEKCKEPSTSSDAEEWGIKETIF